MSIYREDLDNLLVKLSREPSVRKKVCPPEEQGQHCPFTNSAVSQKQICPVCDKKVFPTSYGKF